MPRARTWLGAALLVGAQLVLTSGAARAEIGAYLLFDMNSSEVLAQHRASTPWYPASLTKLMTAYVTFDAVAKGTIKMTSPVRISPQARQQPPSRMGFPVGTVITVETALRIILTKSANDVSVALAEAVGGTGGQFVTRMNETAAALGMASSSFDNPHGLPNAKQIVTARDMAVLMRKLQDDFPQYADYFTMGGVQLGKQRLRNHNALIRRFRGADGMKTGFICASGFNLSATATRDGVRLGAVVLGGLTSQERDQRTAELLAKGFEAVRNGGRVALDGFGDLDAVLDYVPVSGERPAHGKVEDLPAASEPIVDIRTSVCGAARAITRYSGGVVSSREALDAQRDDLVAWQTLRDARIKARAEILSAPQRPLRVATSDAAQTEQTAALPRPAGATLRSFSDGALRPVSWQSEAPVVFPIDHPRRSEPEAASPPSDFAPKGWVASPARPQPNPFEVAGLRMPLPPQPSAQPLGYLEPAIAQPTVRIAMGGADDARPEPLSGTVVGGGPAPFPKSRPTLKVSEMTFTTVTDDVVRQAIEIRGPATVRE